jgi:TonB-linked SusC/RagA family outer membrane protein
MTMNKKINHLLLLILFMACSGQMIAQQKGRIVTGKVTTINKQPVIGASISLQGTKRNSITDNDGGFSIQIDSSDQILLVDYIGMKSESIKIGNQKTLTITLEEISTKLDEVVVIGYGTVKKKDATGSVASLKSDEISRSGGNSIEQVLSGRISGVVINAADNAPGAGANIKIRGTASISASSAPLYVIDGFPIEGDYNSGSGRTITAESPLTSIDPSNIESIDILKDASATAIYGARGANGVVIVTTKGAKGSKMKVNFESKFGFLKNIDAYDVADADFYAQLQHDRYFPWDKRIVAPTSSTVGYNFWDLSNKALYNPNSVDTNWMKQVTRMGSTQTNNLTLSGGNEKGNYLASLSNFKMNGTLLGTNYQRTTANIKANGKPATWLDLDFNSFFSFTETNGTVTVNGDGGKQEGGIMTQIVKTSPFRVESDQSLDPTALNFGNPLDLLNGVKMLRKGLNSRINFSSTIKPLKGLNIKTLVGITKNRNNSYSYAPSTTSWGVNYSGRGVISNTEFSSLLLENTINYSKTLAKRHQFNFLAGQSYQYNYSFSNTMESQKFTIESLGYNNMGIGEVVLAPVTDASDNVLLSYFGRFNYSLNNKYLFTATYRADGSSKFAQNNKWGYFPSFSLAWKIAEEPFIKKLNVFDDFKIRAGWGLTGNPNIAPYQSLTNLTAVKYPNGNSTLTTGVYPMNIANPNLKWEASEQSNIGVDLVMFNSRLSLTVDAYIKKTNNLLLNGDIPGSTGFSKYLYNAGSIENKGLEFAINSKIIDNTFKWSLGINTAFNKNNVTSLGNLISNNWMLSPGSSAINTTIVQVGQPLGAWYGYQTDGLYQQSDFTWTGGASGKYVANSGTLAANDYRGTTLQPGMWKFRDVNGDGKVDINDKTILGISQPKFTGGLNSRFEYKNFDLSSFIEFSYGRKINNENTRQFTASQVIQQNTIKYDYWRPIQYGLNPDGTENRNIVLAPGNITAKYPASSISDQASTYALDMHDGYMEDGSFIRISNITFGYNFSKSLMEKIKFNSLRIYLSAQNLYTFTKYSGYDPSVSVNDLNGLRPGYDLNSYPLSKSYLFGLTANF